jgi:hypothetical protein
MGGRYGGSGGGGGEPPAPANVPTPGVFGYSTIIRGAGTEDDPYVVIHVWDALNFNAAALTPVITFPQAVTGVMRLKQVNVCYTGAAAGIKITPFIALNDTALSAAVLMPLGPPVVTTSASDHWTWEESRGMEFATHMGGAGMPTAASPFYFTIVGYAATDDMVITIEFEWWS